MDNLGAIGGSDKSTLVDEELWISWINLNLFFSTHGIPLIISKLKWNPFRIEFQDIWSLKARLEAQSINTIQ